ncbi:MAG: NRDE family protein [Deltaproteobacteria bacterium]|nr:NRDE family protein [Deltaproteobacteria bacterium]
MCLILFAYHSHPAYKLILAGNRDEFYERPSAPAKFWDDAPQLLAGKDLLANGTWFGITKGGRFAGITNYRDPKSLKKNAPSRGLLVSRFLLGSESPRTYLEGIMRDAHKYNGFNLIIGHKNELYWYSNRGKAIQKLNPGVYGLSNHLLDTPWPKVVNGKSALTGLISKTTFPGSDDFFRMLGDLTAPDDDALPETGVGLERERMLSPIFISSPDYGTRSSTLLFIDRNDHVTFIEKTYNKNPTHASTVKYEFQIEFNG